MNEAMTQILNAATPILCLLITAGGAYLVALLKRQTAQIEKDLDNETATKYMNMAVDAVAQAVAYTAQTFADSLKAEGKFTKEKQLEAFEKSKNKTLEILGDTTVAALREIYGDFDAWLETKIEQVCRETKAASESQIKAATADAATTAASVAATIATTAVQNRPLTCSGHKESPAGVLSPTGLFFISRPAPPCMPSISCLASGSRSDRGPLPTSQERDPPPPDRQTGKTSNTAEFFEDPPDRNRPRWQQPHGRKGSPSP